MLLFFFKKPAKRTWTLQCYFP